MKKLTLLITALVALSSQSHAQIASLDKDLVFTPVVPCRIFDTRLPQQVSGGIAAGDTRLFSSGGIGSYAFQGGVDSDCGLDIGEFYGIAAIAINITVISPASAGYITAYPSNKTKPLAATVNFKAGDIVGNASVVKVAQDISPELAIFSSSQTHLAGDVVGYYSKPKRTALECTTPSPSESFVLPAGYDSFHYTTSKCSTSGGYGPISAYCYSAATNNVVLTGSGVDPTNGAFCAWRNLSGASQTVIQTTLCCRIPGR